MKNVSENCYLFLRRRRNCNRFAGQSPYDITDASYLGLWDVVEQEGRPVICLSRRLSKAEQGYALTMLEALTVVWAVKRLHKYLFNT